MKQIPLTIVMAILTVIVASWPSVQVFADSSITHHYLVHYLYVLSGGLFGMQTASWMGRSLTPTQLDEGGVSS